MQGFCRRFDFRRPKVPKLWRDPQSWLMSQRDHPDNWWFAYPLNCTPQLSFKTDIFEAECKLVEILERIMDFLNPLDAEPAPANNGARALELYQELVTWKYTLPQHLQLAQADLPAAILLHIYFDIILITLLQPFEKASRSQLGELDPLALSYSHAHSIIATMWTFRAIYTLRHEYWLIHAASTSAFRVLFHLEYGPLQLDVLLRSCQSLKELGEHFPLANDLLQSISLVAKKKNLQLPAFATEYLPSEPGHQTQTIMQFIIPQSNVLHDYTTTGRGGQARRLTIAEILAGNTPHDNLD
jgi:hypothetical protein